MGTSLTYSPDVVIVNCDIKMAVVLTYLFTSAPHALRLLGEIIFLSKETGSLLGNKIFNLILFRLICV